MWRVMLLVALLLWSCDNEQSTFLEKENAMQREQMVVNQIASRGVKDTRVLNAMRKIERHRFVPEEAEAHAYEDRPLPIGNDQTISQPYIVALMTELLELKPDDRVLEVGTGSAYQTAVLAELAEEVYTVEIVEELGVRALRLLGEMGYENVHFSVGDGRLGWPEAAPFDGIIATAAPEKVPQALINQLKPGGRLVIPVGKSLESQRLMVYRKTDEGVVEEPNISVRFVPMTGGVEEER